MVEFIYCRGGDKHAPELAKQTNMKYGVRYDYTAYDDDVYMLDAGLKPKWITYKRKVRKYHPKFALVPDLEVNRELDICRDAIQIALYIQDLRELGVPLIGVTPKFEGALSQIELAGDIVICESIPSSYSGYLFKDYEIVPHKYHLLGGDIRTQIEEVKRIQKHGGQVISMDGNKLAMKAAYGQIWTGAKWQTVNDTTKNNALNSAKNIMKTLEQLVPA